MYERHLIFDNVIHCSRDARDRFEAVARSVRDVLSQRWVRTEEDLHQQNPKRVYYLSMEFLIGRSLDNNITNLLLDPLAKQAVRQEKIDLLEMLEQEPDAGLGQRRAGTLGGMFPGFHGHHAAAGDGLWACAMSTAFSSKPSRTAGNRNSRTIGCATLTRGKWPRPNETVEIKFNCSFELRGGSLQRDSAAGPQALIGMPYDRPVVGYGGKTINTLRLWAATAPDYFDFQEIQQRRFCRPPGGNLTAESLTRVLYPDDSTSMGQGLRFVQEYFLVACSLADLVRRFRADER